MDIDNDEIGTCDVCGDTYDTANRFDHDANEGLCWEHSEYDPADMTTDEWLAYLDGADWHEVFAN